MLMKYNNFWIKFASCFWNNQISSRERILSVMEQRYPQNREDRVKCNQHTCTYWPAVRLHKTNKYQGLKYWENDHWVLKQSGPWILSVTPWHGMGYHFYSPKGKIPPEPWRGGMCFQGWIKVIPHDIVGWSNDFILWTAFKARNSHQNHEKF